MIDKLPLDPRSDDNNRLIVKINELIELENKRQEKIERMAHARAAKK